jgi:hypothetical protein
MGSVKIGGQSLYFKLGANLEMAKSRHTIRPRATRWFVRALAIREKHL